MEMVLQQCRDRRVRSPAVLATILLLVALLVSASKTPSRDECRSYIDREQEGCQSPLGGVLGWISDVIFAESRYMKLREQAIAQRERDLIKYKVEQGHLPREALRRSANTKATASTTTGHHGNRDTADQPSLLTRVWNELFAESRYMQQRREAIAAREQDLLRQKQSGQKVASAATHKRQGTTPETKKQPSTKADKIKKQVGQNTKKKMTEVRQPLPATLKAEEEQTSGGWLYDTIFAESKYMKLREEAITRRKQDLIRLKVSQGELPEEALLDPNYLDNQHGEDHEDNNLSLWDKFFCESRQFEIRRQALAARQRDLIEHKVAAGEMPEEALDNPELYTNSQSTNEPKPSIWELLFPEKEQLQIRADAIEKRRKDLILTKIKNGQLSEDALYNSDDEQSDDETPQSGTLMEMIFSERRQLKIRQQALEERRRDLIRSKIRTGELPEEALDNEDFSAEVSDIAHSTPILQRIGNEIFAEGRYWEERNRAIADREADLQRMKLAQAGQTAYKDKRKNKKGVKEKVKQIQMEMEHSRKKPVGKLNRDYHHVTLTAPATNNRERLPSQQQQQQHRQEKKDEPPESSSTRTKNIKHTQEITARGNYQQSRQEEEHGPDVGDNIIDVDEGQENTDNMAILEQNDDEDSSDESRDEESSYDESSDEESSDDESSDEESNDDESSDEKNSDEESSDDESSDEESSDEEISDEESSVEEISRKIKEENPKNKMINNKHKDKIIEDTKKRAGMKEVVKIDNRKRGQVQQHDTHDNTKSDVEEHREGARLRNTQNFQSTRTKGVSMTREKQQHKPIQILDEPAETNKKKSIRNTPVKSTPEPTRPVKEKTPPKTSTPTTPKAEDRSPTTAPPPPPSTSTVRSRAEIERMLGLTTPVNRALEDAASRTLRELSQVVDKHIRQLETTYKYADISSRKLGETELFTKSMILFMGQLNSGKSTMINYLLGTEATKTTALPGSGQFRVLTYGEREEKYNGAQVARRQEFSDLQKYGEAFLERLSGRQLRNKLLERTNIVDVPGIMEGRQYSRLYPFNDVCQWFIDRADIIFVVFDPHHLDIGAEMENLLDQLKGHESQIRIILNKADQLPPADLLRVQTGLIWSLSPLLGSAVPPPPIFSGSFTSSEPSRQPGSEQLFRQQEEALLADIGRGVARRVANRVALARRHAVRVRNHARMVDCYLTTYLSQMTFLSNKKRLADDIVSNPHKYRIYEGISRLTNISRYDMPNPDLYEMFFSIHPLYEFPTLDSTCTYFGGCPLQTLETAIQNVLPDLLGRYKSTVERLTPKRQ